MPTCTKNGTIPNEVAGGGLLERRNLSSRFSEMPYVSECEAFLIEISPQIMFESDPKKMMLDQVTIWQEKTLIV
jgi:hypothetical protein